jgi:hypothetical protein
MTTGPIAVWEFYSNGISKDDILRFFKGHEEKYAFQYEKGATGYEHWQGRFYDFP